MGIPERQFPAPETFTVIMGQRMTEQAEVAVNKTFQPQHHLGERGDDKQCEQARKPARRQPAIGTSMCGVLDHVGTGNEGSIGCVRRARHQAIAQPTKARSEIAPPQAKVRSRYTSRTWLRPAGTSTA